MLRENCKENGWLDLPFITPSIQKQQSMRHGHIYNLQPQNNQQPPFSVSQIHWTEQLLQLSQKVGSTTCCHAYLPINLTKREMYFTWGEPFGIANTPIQDVVDIDEAGIKLEHSNQKRGKTPTIMRCDNDGVYNQDQKNNLLLAICGNENYNQSGHEIWEGKGTTLFRLYSFLERIIAQMAIDHPGRSFCFTMDNLNVHHNQMILQLIRDLGHRYVFQAPYWSCDGAIEYVFNTIHSFLLHFCDNLETMDDLGIAIESIIENDLGIFSNYFCCVGFRD